jgi:hypothetical protein
VLSAQPPVSGFRPMISNLEIVERDQSARDRFHVTIK